MASNTKLGLADLRVESFVTALTADEKARIQGGLPPLTEGGESVCAWCGGGGYPTDTGCFNTACGCPPPGVCGINSWDTQ